MGRSPAAKDGSQRRPLILIWILRGLVVSVLAATAFVAANGIWRALQSHVSVQPEYLVAVETIEIQPKQPDWIRADVRGEIVRNFGLPDQLSILDARTQELLRQAFSLHPWIGAVEGIETVYPARIVVKVAYRRPVAMVEVQDGLLPVDANGVLLPPEDFLPEQAQDYPRIAGLQGSPLGPVGTKWGNPLVDAAASLAALLQDDWRELNLRQIQPRTGGPSLESMQWQLVTKNWTIVEWGQSPHSPTFAEPAAREKLARIKRLMSQYETLDDVPASYRDLRKSDSES